MPASSGARPSDGAAHAGHATIDSIYRQNAPTALPFIVKLDAERDGAGLLGGNPEWLARTPVIIVTLSDCLIPGTPASRACVDALASYNRDFAYLNGSIFSVDRELIVRRFDSLAFFQALAR